jgi:hypothetical protein
MTAKAFVATFALSLAVNAAAETVSWEAAAVARPGGRQVLGHGV